MWFVRLVLVLTAAVVALSFVQSAGADAEDVFSGGIDPWGEVDDYGQVIKGCGGGTIRIVRAPDDRSILSIEIAEMAIDSRRVSPTAHFDRNTVPVTGAGTFGAYFGSGIPGQEIAISGDFDSVYHIFRGRIEVSPADCPYMSFAAYKVFDVGTPGPVPAPPSVGSGQTLERGDLLFWPLLALGFAAIGAGLVVRMRSG